MNESEYWLQRLEDFKDYVRGRYRESGGQRQYPAFAKRWIEFCLRRGHDPATFDQALLDRMLDEGRDPSESSRRNYASYLRAWTRWASGDSLTHDAPADAQVETVGIAAWMARLEAYVDEEFRGQAASTIGNKRPKLEKWIKFACSTHRNPAEWDESALEEAFDKWETTDTSEQREFISGLIRAWCDYWRGRGAAEVTKCWVVRAGREGEAVEHNLRNDVVTIAWAGWGDWSGVEGCGSRDALRDFIDERFGALSKNDRQSALSQIWTFGGRIAAGDLVVMPMKGTDGNPIAVGRINGSFEYDPGQPDHLQKRRRVTWLRTGIERDAIGQDLLYSMDSSGTVFGLRKHDAAYRVRHLAEYGVDPGPRQARVSADDDRPEAEADSARRSLAVALGEAAEDLLCGADFLYDIVELLDDKGQVILYGPPGTGKTYLAQRLARALVGSGSAAGTVDDDWMRRLDTYCSHLEQDQKVQSGTHRSIAKRWIEFALERELDPSAWDESLYAQFADLNPDWQDITRKTHRYDLLRWCSWASDGDRSHESGTVSLVQFHPAYSYEDFFEGFRPAVDDAGNMTYRLTPGPLVRIAERARANPEQRYVMVIDEINRANLPRVLGELLFLLEYRNRAVHTQYRPEVQFSLPKNLWFIGTMNTADRSIALIDAAMRRRFHFVPFFPNHGPTKGLLHWWMQRNSQGDEWVARLVDRVNDELVEQMGSDHALIGPSHFMKTGLDKRGLQRIWEYSIEPLIEDQFFGRREVIDSYRFGEVWKRHGPGAAASASEMGTSDEFGEEAEPGSDHDESDENDGDL
ncbi:AAA family ATPase [Candidatus Poriferisodalis sp.]|uniref:AAA family ATPase n=1 Tax=Candidatus Poriferisodalis sp. TaxID=3101277 RepID=UPI003B015BF4